MIIAFIGYDGKMGKQILKYLKENTDFNDFILINKDSTNPFEQILKSSLVIDFSNKDFLYPLALFCAQNKIPLISGTTGLKNEQLNIIHNTLLKNKTSAYICPNFSKGISIIKKVLPYLNVFNKITIEETHHVSKLDSPSGTALQLKSKVDKNVVITSKRKHHYKAIHKISSFDDYEELIIIHKVQNKYAYGELVIKAINTINDFIGLKEEIL
jgi:4-hydroxy-tetrahydrodipicolinate reductase